MRASLAPLVLGCALLAAGGRSAAAPPAAGFDRCEAQVRLEPERKESWRCFWEAARADRAWDEAARRLRSHLASDPSNPRAKLTLAWVEWDRGGGPAEELFREAAEEFGAIRDANGEVFARLGLASLLRQRGRPAEAEPEVEKALRAARSSGDPILLARVRIDQTEMAFGRSDFGEALRYLREAEEIAVASGAHDVLARVLGNKGYAYWEMGSYREGLKAYARQADLFHRMGAVWAGSYEEARARYSMAILAGRLHANGELERQEVERLARESLEAAVRCGNGHIEANARLFLAQWLPAKEAIPGIERALALARGEADRKTERFALRLLGRSRLLADPGRPEEAFLPVEAAIADARACGDLEDAARGSVARAALRYRTGPRERWLEESRQALAAVERIRDLQPEGTVRARVFGPWAYAYYRFAGMLLSDLPASPDRGGDLALAFEIGERMRARVLLDALERAGARPALDPADPDVRRRAEVLDRIASLQREMLGRAPAQAARRSAVEELDRLEAEEAALRDAIARAVPAFARIHPASVATVAEVQSRLRPDQALLSFLLAPSAADAEDATLEGGSWLLLVTRDSARAYRLPERAAIEDRIDVFLGLCRQRDGSEGRAAARLYRDLLAEALGDAGPGVRALVTVPDGVLHRLPLAALRESPDAEPLASRYEIAAVPSATLWLRWKAETSGSPPPGNVLALADPDLPAVPASADAGPASPWLERVRLAPLPRARREARAFARAMGSGSRVWIGADASEAALKRADLGDAGVLHFAAHAVVDASRPERSAVVLAAGDPKEDGLLQMREIAGLALERHVVILSACRSAWGDEVEGEGAIGLARAFFEAGAHAVVGTLWPVRDDETEAFVRRFGQELARGRSVSAAHAAAVRQAIRGGAPAAAWAASVVLGDGDVAPVTEPRRSSVVARTTAVLIVLVAATSGWAALAVHRGRRRARAGAAR